MRREGALKQINRAIVAGWDIPAEERQRSVVLAEEVLADPNARKRETQAAHKIVQALGTTAAQSTDSDTD